MRAYLSIFVYFLLFVLWFALVIFGTSGCSNNADGSDQTPDQEISLEEYLKRGISNRISGGSGGGGVELADNVSSASGSNSTFSSIETTNTQETGVDEADVIEFDGSRLFTASDVFAGDDHFTRIEVHASNPDTAGTSLLGSLNLEPGADTLALTGMYLMDAGANKRLAVLQGNNYYYWWGMNVIATDLAIYYFSNKTVLTIVDAADPADLTIEKRLVLDGALISSRRINNRLYLITQYAPDLIELDLVPAPGTVTGSNNRNIDDLSLNDLLPKYRDQNGNTQPLITGADCVLTKNLSASGQHVGALALISVIDLDNPDVIRSKCLASSVSGIYASQENLYLMDSRYSSGTGIYKYRLSDSPEYRASGLIEGYLPCNPLSYCMGEHDGVLRVLYQESSGGNFWWSDPEYRLDLLMETGGALQSVSTLPNADRPERIGKPGELVYAMRSLGQYAYIVTFENIDPLYVVDLNDPANPFIAGKLEVPGFSSYLHPVDDNLLVGIGKEVVYDENYEITWYQGIKIELFDISDPVHPKTIAADVIGRRGSESVVLYNPHAFAYSQSDENGYLLSIPVSVHNRLPEGGNPHDASQFYEWDHNALYVYKIDFDELTQTWLSRLGRIYAERHSPPDDQSFFNIFNDRSVFHGMALHYVHNGAILSETLDALDN